jgi:hypothetical protein
MGIGLVLGLWYLTPLSTIFTLCRDGQFIGGGKWSTRRKPPTDTDNLYHIMEH